MINHDMMFKSEKNSSLVKAYLGKSLAQAERGMFVLQIKNLSTL